MAKSTKFKALKKFSTPQLLALGGLLAAAGIYLVFFASAHPAIVKKSTVSALVDLTHITGSNVRSDGPGTIYLNEDQRNEYVGFDTAWETNQAISDLGPIGCQIRAYQNNSHYSAAKYNGNNNIPYTSSGRATVSGLRVKHGQNTTDYLFELNCYQKAAGQQSVPIGRDLLEMKVCVRVIDNKNACKLNL